MTAYLVSLVSLMFLTFLVFWLYPDYRADVLRHRMNVLKDELFEHSLNGIISREDPAYKMLERTLNGFIGKANQLTVLHILAWCLFEKEIMQSQGMSFAEQLQDDINQLNKEHQKKVISIYNRMNYQLARHLVWSSPFLILTLVAPLYLYIRIKNHTNELSRYKSIDRADQVAYLTGQTC